MKVKTENASDKIAAFLNFCRDAQLVYSNSCEAVSTLDKATQDILHQIELGSAKDRDKAATQLAHVRRECRKYKDIADNYEPFINLITDKSVKYDAQSLMRKLSECLGEVRKRERNKSNRVYTPRVVKNLEFIDHQMKENEK